MELTGLPCIDPLDAGARTELLAALNGCAVEGGVLRAAILAEPPLGTGAGVAWFCCRGGLAFALESRRGVPLWVDPAETAHAVDTLDAAEPVLRAVEAALGIELEPETLGDAEPPGGARVARVYSPEMTLYLALPRDLILTPSPAPFAPELLSHVPLPVTITLPGPRVAPIDAADLGVGDLVLLGPGPLVAMLDFPVDGPAHVPDNSPNRERVPGRFDPASHHFHPVAAHRAAQEPKQ